MFLSFHFAFLIVFSYLLVVETVVPKYCLQPLNRSDCGMKPTAVVSYWKPGSRCEIAYWRGCPTSNKFENEYECSVNCIFKMSNAIEGSTLERDEEINECEMKLNEYACSDIKKAVYTYVRDECVQKTWRGCPTYNKFADRMSCESACLEGGPVEDLTSEELERIVEIANQVIDAPTTTTVKTTTEATTTTEPPTSTVTEETTTELTTTEDSQIDDESLVATT